MAYTYGWSYQDIITIPLDRLRLIMPNAIEKYEG
ncbi:unnamed protein product, partial [marine sediment metagenome]